MTSKPLEQRLDKILALHPKVIDLSLDRINVLLEKLGNPHDRLPPTIHVAGTNGKGSTIAFLQAIFEEAGYSVHRYISPHLVRFNERILLAGQEVDDVTLIKTLDHLLEVNGKDPITFFELTTAAAFCLFSEHDADVLLLETGLGGRLDATNVVKKPIACVITPISMDHQDFLGETIEEIAREKAGIIKERVPVIMGPQVMEAKTVLQNIAGQEHAPIQAYDDWWTVEANGDSKETFILSTETDDVFLLPLPDHLVGAFQLINAGSAVVTAIKVDNIVPISGKNIKEGIKNALWPCRIQKLSTGSLFQKLPHGCNLYVDGSHNEAGLIALCDWLSIQDQPLHLIIGMKGNKNHRAAYDHLAPYATSVQLVPVQGEPIPEGLQRAFAAFENPADISRVAADVPTAIANITKNFSSIEDAVTILITGSLYLAGDVLASNEA